MLRILYVEDNEGSAYMLRIRLELTDEFEVLVAEDGEKGSEIAAAKRPDLILCLLYTSPSPRDRG